VGPTETAITILLLPLAAFAVLLVAGRRLPREGDFVPTAAAGAAALLAARLFFEGTLGAEHGMRTSVARIPWFRAGEWRFDFGVAVDDLAAVMMLAVTTVSFLVHLYSTAYMRGEDGRPVEGYGRYFAGLALFTFSMLLIVVSDDLLFMFAGWELVGICSTLLIGFERERPAAGRAAIKAFVVNRIGDAGFFVGVALVLSQTGSLDLGDLFASVRRGYDAPDSVWTPGLLAAAALCLFCGAVGKSAQFPLHVWLPDAMEGPTPVSALIHAATMVAAGVYMVARLFPVFAGPGFFAGDLWSSPALWVVAGTGALTALLGAAIALVQTDLKRALAYSTVSQLGFMMAGLGVGSLAGGIFHLFTHAWFKACLFLGAGSVHHAAGTYDMTRLGGLGRRMPVTAGTYLVACLAIAGVPPLAGFWSKEAIAGDALAFGLHHASPPALALGLVLVPTAGLTAYYMLRTYFLVFAGAPREAERMGRAHEMPLAMTGPLAALALLAAVAGGVTPEGSRWLERRLAPEVVVGKYMAARAGVEWAAPGSEKAPGARAIPGGEEPKMAAAARHARAEEAAHGPALALSLLAAAAGIAAAWALHRGPWRDVDVAGEAGALASARAALVDLLYVDRLYAATVIPLAGALASIAAAIDRHVVDRVVDLAGLLGVLAGRLAGVADYWGVDGAVRAAGEWTLAGGEEARRVQTGRLQEYVALTVLLVAFIFLVWVGAGLSGA
jgi:NADH-quinone oxidoreductase subunit L